MKTLLRYALSLLLLTTGTLHFLHPHTFLDIMPPLIPFPAFLVAFTGLCELAAALGLQLPPLRHLTAWLLVLFLLAVFPANLQMYFSPPPSLHPLLGLSPKTLALLRLPLQLPLLAWAYWYTQ
jgi:uncharacterized membrane protein